MGLLLRRSPAGMRPPSSGGSAASLSPFSLTASRHNVVAILWALGAAALFGTLFLMGTTSRRSGHSTVQGLGAISSSSSSRQSGGESLQQFVAVTRDHHLARLARLAGDAAGTPAHVARTLYALALAHLSEHGVLDLDGLLCGGGSKGSGNAALERFLVHAISMISQHGQGRIVPCEDDPRLPGPPPGRYLLASNLHNSEGIMPNYVLQLLRLALLLPPGDLYVMIYESGSGDQTARWLYLLQLLLAPIGVPANITVNGALVRQPGQERIDYLVEVRNALVAPFFNSTCLESPEAAPEPACFTPDHIMFVNDVFFCPGDAVRLMQHQDTDMACAVDIGKFGNIRRRQQRRRRRGLLAGKDEVLTHTEQQHQQQQHRQQGGEQPGLQWQQHDRRGEYHSPERRHRQPVWEELGQRRQQQQQQQQQQREQQHVEHSHTLQQGVHKGWWGHLARAWAFSQRIAQAVSDSIIDSSSSDSSSSSSSTSSSSSSDSSSSSRSGWIARVGRTARSLLSAAVDEPHWQFPLLVRTDKPNFGINGIVFYDIWVVRDRMGGRFHWNTPWAVNPTTQNQLRSGLPLPMYCCWNGMVMLNPEPFRRGLRFRTHLHGECMASECSLLCDDMHRMGFSRVLMDPSVRVGYGYAHKWVMTAPDFSYTDVTGFNVTDWAAVAAAPKIDWAAPDVQPGYSSLECCDKQPKDEGVDWAKCHRVDAMKPNYTAAFMEQCLPSIRSGRPGKYLVDLPVNYTLATTPLANRTVSSCPTA